MVSAQRKTPKQLGAEALYRRGPCCIEFSLLNRVGANHPLKKPLKLFSVSLDNNSGFGEMLFQINRLPESLLSETL